MTLDEKIAMVKALSDETEEEVISAFLTLAGDDLFLAYDSHGTQEEKTAFLDRYASVQVKAAAYYLNKRGWDFEKSHSENGVNRVYETGGLPNSILMLISPKVRVVS